MGVVYYGCTCFSALRDLAGGTLCAENVRAEGCIGRGGLDLLRPSLFLDGVWAARAYVGHDA